MRAELTVKVSPARRDQKCLQIRREMFNWNFVSVFASYLIPVACLSLILLLGPESRLQRAPCLQEGLPLGSLSQVLGVGAAPVDREVEDKQRQQGVQRLCKHHNLICCCLFVC